MYQHPRSRARSMHGTCWNHDSSVRPHGVIRLPATLFQVGDENTDGLTANGVHAPSPADLYSDRRSFLGGNFFEVIDNLGNRLLENLLFVRG